MDKYHMILDGERQFAREVTLGVIVSRPQPVWRYILPGMFILDFLSRNRRIREYARVYVALRRIALDAAQSRLKEENEAATSSRTEREIEQWLKSLKIYSSDLAKSQKAVVDLLTYHYIKLFGAPGDDCEDLIRNAYRSRESYEAHLRQVTTAEKEVDRIILEGAGGNRNLREKLELEARQVAIRRDKILDDLF